MGVTAQLWYSCVHNQIATFGLSGRQSVPLNIGLNIGCSHNRKNRPSEQSAKCNIGQALMYTCRMHIRYQYIHLRFIGKNICKLQPQHHTISYSTVSFITQLQTQFLESETTGRLEMPLYQVDGQSSSKHKGTINHWEIEKSMPTLNLLTFSFSIFAAEALVASMHIHGPTLEKHSLT